jgi:hypothetical protein
MVRCTLFSRSCGRGSRYHVRQAWWQININLCMLQQHGRCSLVKVDHKPLTAALCGPSPPADVLHRVEGEPDSLAVHACLQELVAASTRDGVGGIIECSMLAAGEGPPNNYEPFWRDPANRQRLEDSLQAIRWRPNAAVMFTSSGKTCAVPKFTQDGRVGLVYCNCLRTAPYNGVGVAGTMGRASSCRITAGTVGCMRQAACHQHHQVSPYQQQHSALQAYPWQWSADTQGLLLLQYVSACKQTC